MENLYRYKTDVMRRILHLVSHGYIYYIEGKVPAKKLKPVIYKFTDRYEIGRTSQQRYRAKVKGKASVEFLPLAKESECQFWLLATSGENPVHDLEDMRDATNKKTRIDLDGYELIKTPRKNASAAWTWRMTKENYEAWQERLRIAVRRNNDELITQALFSLKRSVGFSESRKQAYSLYRFAENEWERTQKGDFPYEKIFVSFLGRHQKAAMVPVEKFIKQKNH